MVFLAAIVCSVCTGYKADGGIDKCLWTRIDKYCRTGIDKMFVWNRATRYLGWLKLGIGLFGWFLVESDWLFSSFIKYQNLLSKPLKSCLTLKNGLFNLTVLVLATLTLTRTVNQTVTAYHFTFKWARFV